MQLRPWRLKRLLENPDEEAILKQDYGLLAALMALTMFLPGMSSHFIRPISCLKLRAMRILLDC